MAGKNMTADVPEQDQRTIDAAERDLAVLLAVEPSAEFRARVRARIEAAPQPGRWWAWSWALTTATALVVVAAVAAILMRTGDAGRQPEAVSAARPIPDASGRVPPAPVAIDATGREPGSARPHPEPQALGSLRKARNETPAVWDAGVTGVVVDRAQADAIRRLMDVARLAPRDTTVEPPPELATPEIMSIPLAPMVVEPLGVPDISARSGNPGNR